MSHRVRPAVPSELDSAARVLAAAFDRYPWTRWALPEDRYAERLEEIQRLYLGHALDHGIVLVDDQVLAVAAFLPPDTPAPAEQIQQRIVELHGSRLAALSALPRPDPPAGCWTLETVGVDPAHQGSGMGTKVTADKRNVRLYQRLGFATAATTTIPDGPIVYSMTRNPQSR